MIPVFFFNSSVNKILWKGAIARPYSIFSLAWFCISSIYHDGVCKWCQYWRESFFSYKWSTALITIKKSFSTLEAHVRYLQRAMDININTLPQALYLCLILRNYFQLQKEKILEQSLDLTVSFKRRLQLAARNLSFKRFLKQKAADVF